MSGSHQYGKGFWSAADINENLKKGAAIGLRSYLDKCENITDDMIKDAIRDSFSAWCDAHEEQIIDAISKQRLVVLQDT